MDKRTRSDLEHTFIEFVDKVQELGFKFDIMTKLELTYVKGSALESPHNIANKITLNPDDFIKEEPKVLKEDEGSSDWSKL